MELPPTPETRRLFERLDRLRADLNAPNIRDRSVLYNTLYNYLTNLERDVVLTIRSLPPDAKRVFNLHHDIADEQLELVENGRGDRTDDRWKTDTLNRFLPALDQFMALNPFASVTGRRSSAEGDAGPEASGGKRRKTRKGKSRRLGRTRYSRRR